MNFITLYYLELHNGRPRCELYSIGGARGEALQQKNK